MQQYLDLVRHCLDNGSEKTDRTGVGTLATFGYQMRFDLTDGFPCLTTKKLHLRSIIRELLWFLKGDTNIAYLQEKICKHHRCVFCNRSFATLDACHKHMKDKSHRKISLDSIEGARELSMFYDFRLGGEHEEEHAQDSVLIAVGRRAGAVLHRHGVVELPRGQALVRPLGAAHVRVLARVALGQLTHSLPATEELERRRRRSSGRRALTCRSPPRCRPRS